MLKLEELNLNGLKIYQDDALYKFTSDAVLLTRFATVKKGDEVADFCSGSGIVGLHLYALNAQNIKSVTLFEMQKPLFDMSVESIKINDLTEIFTAVNTRVQDIGSEYAGKFSLIVCNPPYMPEGHGFTEENRCIAVCRTELELKLPQLIKAISRALKFGGRTAIVHRADRLADLICEMRNNNIEPKRLRTVSSATKEPYLILVEGVKGGKSGIKIESEIKN